MVARLVARGPVTLSTGRDMRSGDTFEVESADEVGRLLEAGCELVEEQGARADDADAVRRGGKRLR